jgi:hypothetical protein
MKKMQFGLLLVIFFSCTHSPVSLPEQLKANFSAHLKKADSTLILDSFKVIRLLTINDKLGTIIRDTFYYREFYRVQNQLANAVHEKKEDSARFYQEEVSYMKPQIDSLTSSISGQDSVNKQGIIAICQYRIRKNTSSPQAFVFYAMDTKMNVMNSDDIDSSISRTYRGIK